MLDVNSKTITTLNMWQWRNKGDQSVSLNWKKKTEIKKYHNHSTGIPMPVCVATGHENIWISNH